MRSVPHRVVCLLGLDDGAFPRKAPRDGDDLLLDAPHVGERDPRTEDRQLLLDALLAATDRLIITYTGHDERTNLKRPPAVPVGELLDVVGRGVVEAHPLQPFDPRNFASGAPWSFDRVLLEGARALAGERALPRPFLEAPLPAAEPGPLALEDLVKFVEHPVRAFLRQRLGISVGDYSDEVDDALPVELDTLERWGVGQRLLDATIAGTDGRTAIRAEIARGTLPPGQLGRPVVNDIWQEVAEIAGAARALIGAAPEPSSVDVKIDLADRRLTGTVPGVRGRLLTTVTYSQGQPAPPAGGVGAAAGAGGHGGGLRGGDDRPRAGLGASPRAHHRRAAAGAGSGRGAGAARAARRPLRPRDARAAPAGLPHVGGVRRGRQRARGVGVRPLPEGGPRPRARAGVRRALAVRRAARRRAAGRTSAGIPASGRASASTRGGCGTGCSATRTWRTSEPPFDICGPLPSGITVLEASAGTGKTYTIAALAARYVAEGTPLRPAAARHVHAHGHGRAARPGARAARGRRARAGGRAGGGSRRRRAAARGGLAGGGRAAARPARARAGRLRHGDDRHDPRVLPGGAGRARRGRRPRAGRDARRGPRRPARRGGRRPLRAPLHDGRGRAADHARGGAADRARDDAQPGGADRAARDRRARACRRCAAGWPRASATSSSGASARARSSPTTTC